MHKHQLSIRPTDIVAITDTVIQMTGNAIDGERKSHKVHETSADTTFDACYDSDKVVFDT